MRVERLARITFRLASDDGSRLYIDDDEIIDNWGEHGFNFVGSGYRRSLHGTVRHRSMTPIADARLAF